MDSLTAFEEGFRAELSELWQRHDGLAAVPIETAQRLGREGARAAVAPFIWKWTLGDVVNTTEATEFLAITRQALHQRLRARTVLGVPTRLTTYYPTWQFDREHKSVRPLVAKLLRIFREADEELEPAMVASWAITPQVELGGERPAELIAKDEGAHERILTAARHSASALAQ